jgi:predicted RNase H-like nuclease (RuvC/YqgF family)
VNEDKTGSSSSGDAKVKRLEEEVTKLEAKFNSAQARALDLSRQLEALEAGKGKTGNQDTGKEKELEIKVNLICY